MRIVILLLIIYGSSIQVKTCPERSSDLEVYPQENQNDEAITPLYFGLMVSSSEGPEYEASVITAVQSALDSVSSNSSILNGYSLHYTLTFSECTGSNLVGRTLTQLSDRSYGDKLGLIEAGCTDTRANFARAYLASSFNIPQITCSRTIRDGSTQLNIFEMSPSLDDVIVPALERVITHYNWSRVALMVENKQSYIEITKALEDVLRGLNITLSVTKLSMENKTLELEDTCGKSLFDLNFRIFVLIMSSKMANHLLCKAYNQGIKYPKYEFILASKIHSNWWITQNMADGEYGCSSQQRTEVLKHSLAFERRPISVTLDKQGHSMSLDYLDKNALYCYDAVWTLALALNKTVTTSGFANNISLRSDYLKQHNLRHIQQTDFMGKTGAVRFGANGARLMNKVEVLVLQYQFNDNLTSNMDAVQIGSYKGDEFFIVENKTTWPKGLPYDGSPVHEIVTVAIPLVVTYYLIATVGVFLTIICFVFNFAFRNAKVVRLTSPNLNYLIIIGVLFSYISVYWYHLPSTNPNVILTACCLQIWFLGTGYFIIMGTITAKLWRIYYIFRNPSSKKHAITDRHLLVFILSLEGIVALIILTYTIIEVATPGYELNKVLSRDHQTEIVGELAVETHYEFYACSRVPYTRTIAVGAVFAIIMVLLGGALFMGFRTRKIRIKGLNDAKYITGIVYCNSISSLIFFIVLVTLRSHVNVFPAVLCLAILVSITTILGLVFLPKMINLYRDPKGEHIFSNEEQPVLQLSTVLNNMQIECTKPKCQKLQTTVKDLEQRLKSYERESRLQSSMLVQSTNVTIREIETENKASENPPISQEDMSLDEFEQTVEVSWEADSSTFHIGHRV